MNSIIASGMLGALQGITEFLPVSSSGHLVLVQGILDWPQKDKLPFDVMLHLATLFAICIFFRKKIYTYLKGHNWKILGLILIGTIPAGLTGILCRNQVAFFFSQLQFVLIFLLFTGLFLLLVEKRKSSKYNTIGEEETHFSQVFLIGCFQALAILPGISRSGMTIGCGLLLGMKREWAFEFSFLLAIPVILGAVVLEAKEIVSLKLFESLTGFIFSLSFGILGLKLLLKAVKQRKLSIFSWYLFILGIFGLVLI